MCWAPPQGKLGTVLSQFKYRDTSREKRLFCFFPIGTVRKMAKGTQFGKKISGSAGSGTQFGFSRKSKEFKAKEGVFVTFRLGGLKAESETSIH